MNVKVIFSILILPLIASGCDTGVKEISEKELQEFFSKHRVGSSSNYAVMKNENIHLLTIHGYTDNLSVCQELIKPYNENASLSVLPGIYSCKALN